VKGTHSVQIKRNFKNLTLIEGSELTVATVAGSDAVGHREGTLKSVLVDFGCMFSGRA
jgi:hypothetical protein